MKRAVYTLTLTFTDELSCADTDHIVGGILNGLASQIHRSGLVPEHSDGITHTIMVKNECTHTILGINLFTKELL